jgi:hypothetical protein
MKKNVLENSINGQRRTANGQWLTENGKRRTVLSRAGRSSFRRFLAALGMTTVLLCPALAQDPGLLVCRDRGYTLTSTADAAGASAVTYTWYENGSPVDQSNTTTLSIAAGTKNAGTYRYVRKAASDDCADVSSNTFTVVVLQPEAPVINVSAAAVCRDAGDLVFTVAPAANTTYSWSGEPGTPAGDDRSTYTVSGASTGAKAVQATATVYYEVNSLQKTCTSILSEVASAVVHPLPAVAQTGTAAFCGGGTHTLGVEVTVAGNSVPEGEVTITWYSDDAGTNVAAGSGNAASYTTPNLTASASYYVGATVNATGCAAAGLTRVDATVNLYEGAIGGRED